MKKGKQEQVTITSKKSGMVAKSEDYSKLSERHTYCLPCEIEEMEEEINLIYDTRHVKSFVLLKKDDKLRQILVLRNVYILEELRQEYDFSMAPENLYYDLKGNVYILHKDLISKDYSEKQNHFLEEYKSLIGATLQQRYSYEDYLKGGQSLLKKESFLKEIYEMDAVEGIMTHLENYYDEILEQKEKHNIEVKRSAYRNKNICIVIFSILSAVLIGILCYVYLYKLKEQDTIIEIYGDYLMEDYVSIIDESQKINISNLNGKQKYVLAVAYVKGENLTAEQKNNILNSILLGGDEKIMDYWIYLGKGNVSEAENIALQYSNDEMLLYAYLKEKQMLESNTELTGEEKSAALSELQNKIDALADTYTTEEEANE